MKHLTPRELVLLCSPVLVIALAGVLLSLRKPPSLNAEKPYLELSLDQATTLEAFRGIDAALVVQLKGANVDKMDLGQFTPYLELKTPTGTQTSRSDNCFGQWCDVWRGSKSSPAQERILLRLKPVPPGALRFKVDARISPKSTLSPVTLHPSHLSATRKFDRTKIIPLDFKKLPRSPLIVLRSVRITQVFTAAGKVDFVTGECVFDLSGAAMNAQTPTEFSFSGVGYTKGTPVPTGSIWSTNSLSSPETPMRRTYNWTLNPQLTSALSKRTGRVSGRISAGGRWPLAFQAEPFDFAKVKVGQKLKFKSWPLPRPLS